MATHEVFACRYWKMGGSYGLIIPKPVRDKLPFVPGDLVLMTTLGPLLICRKADPSLIMDRPDTIPADAIPGKPIEHADGEIRRNSD